MEQVMTNYKADYIDKVLQRTELASLNTFTDGGINSRFMHFACDESLKEFYFMTHKDSDKISEIRQNPEATVSIISQGEKLADYCETTAKGRISIFSDIHDEAVKKGMRYLAEKSAMVKALLDRDSMGELLFLRMDVRQVVFRVYRDIVNNVPKTILNF
jgi:general stress protein 26